MSAHGTTSGEQAADPATCSSRVTDGTNCGQTTGRTRVGRKGPGEQAADPATRSSRVTDDKLRPDGGKNPGGEKGTRSLS